MPDVLFKIHSMEASSTTTICAVTWRALAILLLISSYALGDAVAAPKATDQALKDCYKDARDDMAGNFRHCGCISTDKEASTEPLSQKDGNVTIRTISDAFSEFQQYSFGLKSTFSDQRVRRGDEPAIHLSASALYQEASCTTGDPMDPSICASGMGRIEYVAGCVDSESEGGVRLSKDQCLSSIKKAMGHDW